MRTWTWRAGAIATALACTVVAGCGQKPGVGQLYAGPGLGVGTGTGAVGENGLPLGEGVPGAPGSTDSTGSTGPTGSTGSSGDSGTGSSPGSPGTNGPGQPGANTPTGAGPNDKQGITKDTISIGVHAPVTGAAAFPAEGFKRGVGLYADFINSKGGINGRRLIVHFEDDAFNPGTARAKCQMLNEQKKVFLLVGGGGSDQIDVCARYAAAKGVPYIAATTHEVSSDGMKLNSLPTFYALSPTYEQQLPLLANVVRGTGAKKLAVLVAENGNLNNTFNQAKNILGKAANIVLSARVQKKVSSGEANGWAAKICNSGAEVVFWNASPAGLAEVTKSMTCRPKFVGVGNTIGLNLVATTSCPQLEGAQVLSSWPGLNSIDSMDPDYRRQYNKKHSPNQPDDIGMAMWGLEKAISQAFAATGKDIGRHKLMTTLNGGKVINNGIFPSSKFSAGDRFGSSKMHLLRAKCTPTGRYETDKLNVG